MEIARIVALRSVNGREQVEYDARFADGALNVPWPEIEALLGYRFDENRFVETVLVYTRFCGMFHFVRCGSPVWGTYWDRV